MGVPASVPQRVSNLFVDRPLKRSPLGRASAAVDAHGEHARVGPLESDVRVSVDVVVETGHRTTSDRRVRPGNYRRTLVPVGDIAPPCRWTAPTRTHPITAPTTGAHPDSVIGTRLGRCVAFERAHRYPHFRIAANVARGSASAGGSMPERAPRRPLGHVARSKAVPAQRPSWEGLLTFWGPDTRYDAGVEVEPAHTPSRRRSSRPFQSGGL